MKVSELLAALSYGELNGLSMSLDGSGDIDEISQSRIIHYANQALTALYTRFPHKIDYVDIELSDLIRTYYLRPEFAVSDTVSVGPKYILDNSVDPLDQRITKIISIRDEDAENYRDRDVLINDTSHKVSVKTVSYDGFMVKEPVAGNIYTVEYQCLHPLLTVSEPQDNESIHLAPVLHEALELRIASKIYGAIGGEDSIMKSQSMMGQYEQLCVRAEASDMLQLTSSNEHDKVREGGWE